MTLINSSATEEKKAPFQARKSIHRIKFYKIMGRFNSSDIKITINTPNLINTTIKPQHPNSMTKSL